MEALWNGIVLAQTEQAFRLGTDSVLLAQFLTLPKNARVVDLGAGCGTLGLLLCARDAGCTVLGVELDAAAQEAALENIAFNHLEHRMTALLGDVRELRAFLPANSADCVIANPPYFPAGSGKTSERFAMARSEATLPLTELCAAAAWLLPSGGRFALVHRPERLCDIFCAMRAVKIEPKRVQLVRHKPDAAPCLALIEGRRDGKAGLHWEPDFIEFTHDGQETAAYRAAYHRGEL